MKRLAMFGIVWGTVAIGNLAWAEDKQETLKATVVEPYADQKASPNLSAPNPQATADGAFEDTVCSNGSSRRLVQLTPGDRATNKPCEVHYKKETEQPGHDQLIWSTASNMESCKTKAKQFVAKVTSWGWTCSGAKH